MQHLVDRHDVELVALQRQVENIAVADRGLGDAGAIEIGPGDRQHVTAGIDTDAAPVKPLEELENAPGARAEIEEGIDRLGADHPGKPCFHLRLADMETTHRIPFRSVAAEIGLRLVRADLLERAQTLVVTGEDCIGRFGGIEKLAGERDGRAALAQPEERPGAFLVAVDQSGFRQQLQMARNARLGLAENIGEIRDGQVAMRQQREQAKACRFARRLQDLHDVVQSEFLHVAHGLSNQDIKICLCD